MRRRGRNADAHWLLGGLLVLAVAGCGGSSGVERYPLTGTVSFEGQPIPRGWIVFAPDGKGAGASADIHDGKYATPDGLGTIGGPHKIEIVAFDGVAIPDPAAEGAELPNGRQVFSCTIRRDIRAEESVLNIDITAAELGVEAGKVTL